MADFTAKDVRPAPSHRSRHARRQEGARGSRGDIRSRGSISGSTAWPERPRAKEQEATQGAVATVRNGDAAAVVELRCETDFVAKADEFVALTDELAALVAAKGEERRRASSTKRSTGCARRSKRTSRSGGCSVWWPSPDRWSTRTSTNRPAAASTRWRWSSMVAMRSWPATWAVHIAFTKPTYLSRDEVPAADVEAERATVAELSRKKGKPEAALDKIVDGRMNGWLKERVLLDQSYVKDEKQTITGMLGSARIVGFAQVVIGS